MFWRIGPKRNLRYHQQTIFPEKSFTLTLGALKAAWSLKIHRANLGRGTYSRPELGPDVVANSLAGLPFFAALVALASFRYFVVGFRCRVREL
jgi:hypothetical protein